MFSCINRQKLIKVINNHNSPLISSSPDSSASSSYNNFSYFSSSSTISFNKSRSGFYSFSSLYSK